jgi:glycosyltransferase involved in cell wall biosynthesis
VDSSVFGLARCFFEHGCKRFHCACRSCGGCARVFSLADYSPSSWFGLALEESITVMEAGLPASIVQQITLSTKTNGRHEVVPPVFSYTMVLMHISFVIPAYNEEKHLLQCIAAVERELARTPCDAEIIVVNNASTDRTGEIARANTSIIVVDEPNKGLVRARHAGHQASTGEIIAHIDADTMLTNGWLQTVLDEFERDENLAALSGPYIYYDLSLFQRAVARVFYFIGYVSHIINHYIFRSGAMLQGGNFIVRRTHFDQAGGFDTTIEFYGEETDVARRISHVGKVKWTFKLPMYTSGRRLAKEGVIITGLRYAGNYFYVLIFGKPLTTTYTDIRE